MSLIGAIGILFFFLAEDLHAQQPVDPAALWDHAATYRDEWGTPHIYADTLRALAFAFGYAQAEDHLEPMLIAYRIANGRAAEILGEELAASDEFALKMGHALLARNGFGHLDPVTQDLCEGFAIGVNAWLVEHPDRAPGWAEGVRPEDVLALLHCYLMSMAPFDLPGVYHRPPPAVSSNAWAIAPSRSASGEPILVINPHAFYESPFRWYEAHLVCQDLNVAGATLFGLPMILQGHNAVLGWALTPNQPDFADIYIEPGPTPQRNPKSINAPILADDAKRIEMLLLANARPYYVNTPNGSVERSVPCLDTPRGPIMGTYKGRLCTYQIGGYRDFGTLAQLVEMARARDLPAFQAALAMHQLPCFHVVYADREGNILYLYNVKTGDKAVSEAAPKPRANRDSAEEPPAEDTKPPALIDWTTPVRADDPVFAWRGIIPVEALPCLINPPSGYVQACGSPPWAATDNAGIKPEAFPPWFARDPDTYRAQRVRALLNLGKRSFHDCQSMLYDIVAPFALEAAPRLIEAAKQHADFVANAHPDLSVGIDALGSWNKVADTTSTGMTFFHAWWTALRNQDPETFKTDQALFAALRENAPEIQERSLHAAVEAAKMMRNEFQSLAVPWGDVHTITRGPREVALAGAVTGEPIFTASDYVYADRKWRVTYGYGFAMVVAFGEKPTAVSMCPFGASEDPNSPHYADQLDLMAERRFKVTRFEFDDVQRNATRARGRQLLLRPKGVEALFTIRAATPIEARLNASSEAPTSLPEDLVPFTLFVATEQAPRGAPTSTHMEVYVPPVLCARENLDKLAVYACDAPRDWVRLEAQQLELEARTFVADDNRGPRVYAVLGPSLYRATRLPIPKENQAPEAAEKLVTSVPETRPLETSNPLKVEPEPSSNGLSAEEGTPRPSRKAKVTWGSPPRQRAKPFVSPDLDEAPDLEPPNPDLKAPEAPTEETKSMGNDVDQKQTKKEKRARKSAASTPQDKNTNVKRNFNLGPPAQQQNPFRKAR